MTVLLLPPPQTLLLRAQLPSLPLLQQDLRMLVSLLLIHVLFLTVFRDRKTADGF